MKKICFERERKTSVGKRRNNYDEIPILDVTGEKKEKGT